MVLNVLFNLGSPTRDGSRERTYSHRVVTKELLTTTTTTLTATAGSEISANAVGDVRPVFADDDYRRHHTVTVEHSTFTHSRARTRELTAADVFTTVIRPHPSYSVRRISLSFLLV